ncbi:hypothetical protein [Mycobacterium sp. KBS0706]|uniref:DUF7697 family protein n=1 Tax=Mycobacterium sp. KBS0706 TaxID=2578109 RepID=UPI001C8F4323|nr:hypothetical protein [Mycobacterium sp. KBS0706]
MLQRCGGQVRYAGMAGVAVGLDLSAALTIGEDLGYDRRALAVLLPMAEAAAIEALNERAKNRSGSKEDGDG